MTDQLGLVPDDRPPVGSRWEHHSAGVYEVDGYRPNGQVILKRGRRGATRRIFVWLDHLHENFKRVR